MSPQTAARLTATLESDRRRGMRGGLERGADESPESHEEQRTRGASHDESHARGSSRAVAPESAASGQARIVGGQWTLVDGHPLDRPSPHRRSKNRTRALISTDFQSVDLPVGPRVSPNLLNDTPALATVRTNAQASMHARTSLSSGHWSRPLNGPQCSARTTRACAPTRRSLGAPAARPHSRPSSDLSSQGVSRLASRLLSRLPQVERRSNREAEHRTRNLRTTGHWTARRLFNQYSTMPTDRGARPSCFVVSLLHTRVPVDTTHCTSPPQSPPVPHNQGTRAQKFNIRTN